MGRLQGKVAIITGGARGMGAATARLFVGEGATVVIADVLDKDGQALAATLGSGAVFRHLDVSDDAAWTALAAETEKLFGKIDVLVNNAGILIFKSIAQTSRAEYERILQVNIVGAFLGLKIVSPYMIKRKSGSIVNISSVDGMKGANSLSAYASSKWALRGLTKVAALEFGHQGVRVNSVHPGGIDTIMTNPENETPQDLAQRFLNVPLQRAGSAEEAAYVTTFLASDEASYVNGAEITVDGGMVAGHYYMGFPGAPGADP